MMNQLYKTILHTTVGLLLFLGVISTVSADQDYYPPAQINCIKDPQQTLLICKGFDARYLMQHSQYGRNLVSGTYTLDPSQTHAAGDSQPVPFYTYVLDGSGVTLQTTYDGIVADVSNKNWVMKDRYRCFADTDCPYTNTPYLKNHH